MSEKLEWIDVKVGDDIYDDVTGEVIQEAKTISILTRPEVPFRSITDLKGYTDAELNTMPSMTNTKDFVPTKKTIAMVLKNHSMVELEAIAEHQKQFGDYDDYASEKDVENSDDYIDEIESQMDVIDYLQGQQAIDQESKEAHSSTKEHLTNEAVQSESGDGVDEKPLD